MMGLPERFNPITTRFEWAIAPFVRPPSWEINGPVWNSGDISISIVICPHVNFQGGAHSKCRDEMSDHRGET